MTAQDLLLGIVAAPMSVALVAASSARVLGARAPQGSARARDGVLALGLAGGFALGLWWIGVRPSLPLASHESAWTWVVWIAVAGALLGALAPTGRVAGITAIVMRWAFGMAAVWLVLRPLVPHGLSTFEALSRAAAWGAAGAFVTTALAVAAGRGGGVFALLPLLVAFVASAFVLLEGGLAITMADAALTLGAATMATASLVGMRGGPPLPAAAAPAVGPALTALLAAGHAYLNSGSTVRMPLPAVLLLLGSACAVFVPRPRWALALAMVLAGGAIALAVDFDGPFVMTDGL